MNTIIASVDIGSNSFRLYVARVSQNKNTPFPQIKILKKVKRTVRLGAGLDAQSHLTPEAIETSCDVLREFANILNEHPVQQLRAVATNSLRMAKNPEQFLSPAEKALGWPIEIISGAEEARLIYSGVHHALGTEPIQKLVVDIGGGSTELIIGLGEDIKCLISLPIGCLSFSQQFFSDQQITAEAMQQAEQHAHFHLASIQNHYRQVGWDKAFGSSGTSKALAAILLGEQWSHQGITLKGLYALKQKLIQTGTVEQAQLQGIKIDRMAVLPGGLAIMIAIFESLQVHSMQASDGALRLGVLYDLLARNTALDVREQTVQNFARRFQLDAHHSAQMSNCVKLLYKQVQAFHRLEVNHQKLLFWAAQLHQIGTAINQTNYKEHSHYILQHANMPGFSEQEKAVMADVIQGTFDQPMLIRPTPNNLVAIVCLRLSYILCKNRQYPSKLPIQIVRFEESTLQLKIHPQWLEKNPVFLTSLQQEKVFWQPHLNLEWITDLAAAT